MLDVVECPACGTDNHLNPEKHRARLKYCRNCRAVLTQPSIPFTQFRRLKFFFVHTVSSWKREIEKMRKTAGLQHRANTLERDLLLQERRAKRELEAMLKKHPHLKKWM